MSVAGSTTDAAVAAPAKRTGLLGMYVQLTKARLSALVVLSTVVGYALATPPGDRVAWLRLLWTVIGTSLAAGSANALNQLWETTRDRRMVRTRNRPLPSGAMSSAHAFLLAIAIGYAGLLVLAVLSNLFAAALALLTILLYVLVYTPLKVRTTLNTLVGAVCGAIPPMIGWVAATGKLQAGAWLLAGLVFVWQLPHFFALAWLYRDDYRRGGFKMLPTVDTRGELTGRTAVLSSLVLILIGLLCPLIGLAGLVFTAGAVLLGAWMLWCSLRFLHDRSADRARRLFHASLFYLTGVFGLLLVDGDPLAFLEPGLAAASALETVVPR